MAEERVLAGRGQVAAPVGLPVEVGLRAEHAGDHEGAALGALGLAPGVAERAVERGAEAHQRHRRRRAARVRAGRVEHALRVRPADVRDARRRQRRRTPAGRSRAPSRAARARSRPVPPDPAVPTAAIVTCSASEVASIQIVWPTVNGRDARHLDVGRARGRRGRERGAGDVARGVERRRGARPGRRCGSRGWRRRGAACRGSAPAPASAWSVGSSWAIRLSTAGVYGAAASNDGAFTEPRQRDGQRVRRRVCGRRGQSTIRAVSACRSQDEERCLTRIPERWAVRFIWTTLPLPLQQ